MLTTCTIPLLIQLTTAKESVLFRAKFFRQHLSVVLGQNVSSPQHRQCRQFPDVLFGKACVDVFGADSGLTVFLLVQLTCSLVDKFGRNVVWGVLCECGG